MPQPTPLTHIPELLCPFTPAIHPRTEQVEHESLERWARRLDLRPGDKEYQKLEAAHFALLACRCHPTASLKDLHIILDYYVWLFFWDDLCDLKRDGQLMRPEEVRRQNTLALGVLHGEEAPWGTTLMHTLLQVLQDVRERLSQRMPAAWLERFIEHHRAYFDTTVQESVLCNSGRVADVETYSAMRRMTGGVYMVTDLIELAEDLRLSENVRTHPFFEQFVSSSANIICWANDLFSLGHELRDGNSFNLVVSVQHEQGLSLSEAIEVTGRLHDTEVRRFLQFTQQIPSFGEEDRQLRRFLHGVKLWIRANVDWSALTERYRVPLPVEEHLPLAASCESQEVRKYT